MEFWSNSMFFAELLRGYSMNQRFVCPHGVGRNYPQLPLVTQIPFRSIPVSSRRPSPPSGPQHPGTSSNLRPGSPELRPLPPLPRIGPPSGEFVSRSSASNPSTVPPAATVDTSSSSLSPSSPSASSATLGSSPVHFRPPSIPQPCGRAPNPSPPKRRPSPPKGATEPVAAHAWNPFVPLPPRPAVTSSDDGDSNQMMDLRKSRPLHSDKLKPGSLQCVCSVPSGVMASG